MEDFKPMTFLDCGAPSIYNEYARSKKPKSGAYMGSAFKDRKDDNHEYVKSEFFQNYLKDYIALCKKLPKNDSLVISSLDVINNAEETLKIWLIMKNEGIDAIPAWHLGEDESFLDNYVNKYKVPYLGLGGMTPNPARTLYKPLNRIWKKYLCNEDGSPKIKVHGFAMTSFNLMFKYPFYSVDSTSANAVARFGGIFVPKRNDVSKCPINFPISFKKEKIANKNHFNHRSKQEQEMILKWIEKFGLSFGKNELVDSKEEGDYNFDNEKTQYVKVIEKGVSNSCYERWAYCAQYFKNIQLSVEKSPIIFNAGSTVKQMVPRFFCHNRLLSFYCLRKDMVTRKELFMRLKKMEEQE